MRGVREDIEAASPPPKGLCSAPSALASAICLLTIAVATGLGGCGGDAGKGFGEAVDKARAAQALSSLQTGLVTLALLQADSGGAAAPDVVAALAAKDPANRYTTDPPGEAGVVQVVGGGGGPVMLVALGQPPEDGRPASYVAAWQGGGTTKYYAGAAMPAYTTEPPAGAGWGSALPR